MKHRSYLCLLAISADASALLALFADGGNILLTTLQFPFAPIAKSLRLLSLSGTVGNLLAWLLYTLLCALPLLPLWLLRRKEKSAKSDLLFILLTPVFLPLISALGVNLVHFGIVFVVGISIGMITPPVAINLFVASSITGMPIEKISKKVIPYLLGLIGVYLAYLYIPLFFPAIIR